MNRVRLLALLSVSALLTWAGSASAGLPPIPDNTWVQLEAGGLTAPNGILAYSGMAYDSDHNKLLVFGGGHCDYSGNEVWSFDIPSVTWTRLYAPQLDPASLCPAAYDNTNYPGAIFDPPGEALADVRPLTRHTYDTVEWLGASHEMFVTGNYTPGSATGYACGGGSICYCWGCNDSWTFNPVSGKWTYRNLARAPQPSGIAAAAYDPVTRKMFVMDRSSIWTYDVSNDSWTPLSPSGPAPPASIELVAEYDSARHVIYRFGGENPVTNELWRYDIGANSWSKLSPTGTAPPSAGGWGLAYDSVNDVLVAFRGGGIGTWVYDPKANSWSAASTSTLPPSPDRVHGDMKYDPVDNLTLLVAAKSGGGVETWAYRYRAGAPAPPDTIPPSPPAGVTGR